jgi:hypothetical protein
LAEKGSIALWSLVASLNPLRGRCLGSPSNHPKKIALGRAIIKQIKELKWN